jgi:two-component system, response regulator RegA
MLGRDILLAEDDQVHRQRLARALRMLGYSVYTGPAAPRTLRLAKGRSVKYAAVDVETAEGQGLELVAELRRELPDVRVVALVSYGNIATALEAMGRGASFYLGKPVDTDDLLSAMTGVRTGARKPDLCASLARVEWEHVRRVLARCGGNVSETARRLGVSRRTVQVKMKQAPPR